MFLPWWNQSLFSCIRDVQNLILGKQFPCFNVQNIYYVTYSDMFTIDLSAYFPCQNLSVKIGKYYPKIINDIDLSFFPNT